MRSANLTKYDIALFIDEHGKTRWSMLVKAFVESGPEKHISRQRLSEYLKELVDEGLVTKTVDPISLMLKQVWRVYPVYTVPKSRKKRLEEIRTKKNILEFIDSANPEEIKKLQQHIKDKV
ncbi:MAG: hypothetical protein CW691_03770 [Candidatus Bathyarchaeum sp.]|nr:MAG: hypothetical protein CW691_03770 [Candidatus Bathyarchaeum sp.]